MRVISNAQSPSSCRDGPLLAAVCVLGAQCKHPLWILSARLPTPGPRESGPRESGPRESAPQRLADQFLVAGSSA